MYQNYILNSSANNRKTKQIFSPATEQKAPTTASPGYPNIPEKQDLGLKSQLMMLKEGFKKDINNTLKEIHR